MIRIILFFAAIAALATGFAWFADRPGALVLTWMGYEIETSLFVAVLLVCVLIVAVLVIWSLLRHLAASPSFLAHFFQRRRQKRGLEALSSGIIAIGSGDKLSASKYAIQARKTLPNEPLTDLLRAQAAELMGDKATARRIYEAMLEAPDTELLGLRGLYLEAAQQKEYEAARQFAERAMRLDPKLPWAVIGLFELQSKSGQWAGALETLDVARHHRHIEKPLAQRQKAVLLAAQAMELEESDMDDALELAQEAHRLAPDLVPAAEIAGRLLAGRGQTSKAAKIIEKSWKLSPHPDLAQIYAFARPGDSTHDRLKRVRALAQTTPHNAEGPIAVAHAAIEAHEWSVARTALKTLVKNNPSVRVCVAMARIEGGEFGDQGRVRAWLAQSTRAPRDPVWVADGISSDEWLPLSPVSGKLDAFEWKVPVEAIHKGPQHLRQGAQIEEEGHLGGDDIFSPDFGLAAPVAASTPAPGQASSSATVPEPAKEFETENQSPQTQIVTAPVISDGSNGPNGSPNEPESAETGNIVEAEIIPPQDASEKKQAAEAKGAAPVNVESDNVEPDNAESENVESKNAEADRAENAGPIKALAVTDATEQAQSDRPGKSTALATQTPNAEDADANAKASPAIVSAPLPDLPRAAQDAKKPTDKRPREIDAQDEDMSLAIQAEDPGPLPSASPYAAMPYVVQTHNANPVKETATEKEDKKEAKKDIKKDVTQEPDLTPPVPAARPQSNENGAANETHEKDKEDAASSDNAEQAKEKDAASLRRDNDAEDKRSGEKRASEKQSSAKTPGAENHGESRTTGDIESDEAEPKPQKAQTGSKKRKRARKPAHPAKPRFYAPGRAPDDPGPDPLDPDEARTPLARFRMPTVKPE